MPITRYGISVLGIKLATEISNADQAALNEKAHPRVTNLCKSSPDISMANSSIALNIEWLAHQALGSDHTPITLSIECDIEFTEASQRTFINFRKADWDGFKNSIEDTLADYSKPNDVYKAEKIFPKAVLRAV